MNYKKISAGMAALIDNYQELGPSTLLARSTFAALSSGPKPSAPPLVHVFVRCTSGKKVDHSALESAGISLFQKKGSVRTALVPLDKVGRLSDEPAVERISPAKQMRPLLDVATNITSAATFKNKSKLTGKGVIVGIVDSGIDASHSMFSKRILSIWDQTINGKGWGTTKYGTVLTGANLSLGTDQNGHGTHVSGIAAGFHSKYLGLAHGASIIMVKTNFQNTGIADGVRYIFSEAKRLKLPAVVNLSLGGHWDAHDGTDDLAESIDQETGPGRIVVAAAGNEGGDAIHGALTIAAGSQAEMQLQITPSTQSGATPWVVLNGWYAGGATCEVSVQSSAGGATSPQAVINSGSPTRTYHVTGGEIQVTTPPASVNTNGDHQFLVQLKPAQFASAVQGGTWKLILKNTASHPCRIDAWSIVPEGARPANFIGAATSPDMKVGSPGTASSAVTVAAYTTRNTWKNSMGATLSLGMPQNDISDFSSNGPLRNGAQKPDVTAPGAMIISALSSQSSPDQRYIINSNFRVDAGTSMASPFIAGLIALLLERNNKLDPAGVKALLQANSAIPGQTPGTWDPKWGFGLIDASQL